MAIALVHLGLGEKEQALEWLERARTVHAPYLRSIWKDPIYDELRSAERFQAVLRAMNLGEER
jgi:hypothetical protein